MIMMTIIMASTTIMVMNMVRITISEIVSVVQGRMSPIPNVYRDVYNQICCISLRRANEWLITDPVITNGKTFVDDNVC